MLKWGTASGQRLTGRRNPITIAPHPTLLMFQPHFWQRRVKWKIPELFNTRDGLWKQKPFLRILISNRRGKRIFWRCVKQHWDLDRHFLEMFFGLFSFRSKIFWLFLPFICWKNTIFVRYHLTLFHSFFSYAMSYSLGVYVHTYTLISHS